MSEEHTDKKPRTEEKYVLYYWPGIPGRGEPIRLAFEQAGVDYEDAGYTQGVSAITKLMQARPAFAPPMLEHGDIIMSQTPNIMLYLGEKLGLVPKDEIGKHRVNEYFLTLSDCQNEIHDTHHPLAVMEYYEDQKDAALKKAKDFRATRIPKFISYFEAVLGKNKEAKGEWLVGTNLTYADLMLYYVLDGLHFAFPRRIKAVSPKYPKVFALYERVKELPRIAAYLKSDRRKPFSNGIYRHYDELDGEN